MTDPSSDVGEPRARMGSWWMPVALIALVLVLLLLAINFWGDENEIAPDPSMSDAPADGTPSLPAEFQGFE